MQGMSEKANKKKERKKERKKEAGHLPETFAAVSEPPADKDSKGASAHDGMIMLLLVGLCALPLKDVIKWTTTKKTKKV